MYSCKPEYVIFDVGGTLFDDGKCDVLAGFAALMDFAENPDVTSKEALSLRWNEYLADASPVLSSRKPGFEVPLSAVIRYASMNEGLKIKLPIEEQEEIFDRFNSTRNIVEGVLDLISAIKKQGIKIGVISNNMMSSASLLLSLKRFLPELDPEFCLTSADLLYTKPDKKIFHCAAAYCGADASACWYCGDSYSADVLGALSAGMKPILLDKNSSEPVEYRKAEAESAGYMAVNNWRALASHLENL